MIKIKVNNYATKPILEEDVSEEEEIDLDQIREQIEIIMNDVDYQPMERMSECPL